MEMSPQRVRGAEFKTVRKGADPDEVKGFLNDVADELERAQNQSTAMEARARAAVARLQEVSGSGAGAPAVTVDASADEADTISRTLLLAQRTADTTVAEARGEAARIVGAANDEAANTRDSTREMAAQLIDEARGEARRVGETERMAIGSEVEALKARRDFLESDVEQLELFLTEQRSRLREAATSLVDITERIPGGIGEARPPLLSASDDESASPDPHGDDRFGDAADTSDSDARDRPAPSEPLAADADDDLLIVTEIADEEPTADSDGPWGDVSGEPTQAMPKVIVDSDERAADDFRFSFDDDRR
jgi:DivIVA domain-containing protein